MAGLNRWDVLLLALTVAGILTFALRSGDETTAFASPTPQVEQPAAVSTSVAQAEAWLAPAAEDTPTAVGRAAAEESPKQFEAAPAGRIPDGHRFDLAGGHADGFIIEVEPPVDTRADWSGIEP